MKVTQRESGSNETVLRGMLTCCIDVQGLIKTGYFLTTIGKHACIISEDFLLASIHSPLLP